MSSQNNNIIPSLNFLSKVINRRLKEFFKKENAGPFSYPEIKLEDDHSPFNHFLFTHKINIEEYIILLLALVPHLQPNFIDPIVQSYLPNGGEFPEIGGVKGNNHRGTMPTGETALFILCGNDMLKRMQASGYFSPDHFFAKENILHLELLQNGEQRMSGKIILQQE